MRSMNRRMRWIPFGLLPTAARGRMVWNHQCLSRISGPAMSLVALALHGQILSLAGIVECSGLE